MTERSGRFILFGDVVDDVVAVPRGPIRADTDTPSEIRFSAGGSAANTAVWLGHLGAAVDFVGLVGKADVERHSALFQAAGVTPHVGGHATLPTGAIVIIVEGEKRTMLTERGANAALDPDAVTDELLAEAAVIHLTGYSFFGHEDISAHERLIERARAAGVAVSIDPASAGFIADYGVDKFLDAIGGATMIRPNLEEGQLLTGLTEPADVAAALAERFELVAVTLGADGVIVQHVGAEAVTVPAVPVTIVDPTGAGDSFSAGFLHEWVRTADPVAAARAGVALAARAVSVMGARPRPRD